MKWLRKFSCISLLVLSFFFAGLLSKNERFLFSSKLNVHEKLQLIPLKEQESLEFFFLYALSQEGFAFTLFGDKPLSIGCFYEMPSIVVDSTPHSIYETTYQMFTALHPSAMKLKKGWRVWQKYQHLFPSRRFAIRGFEKCVGDSPGFLIINKNAFLKAVAQHKDDFER